jgi:hypothetical protein
MKRITLILFTVSFCITGFSQKIKGRVFDNDTKKPLPYASVFLNGTTIGTLTDVSGNFNLEISENKKLPVAVSAIGYYSALLSDYSAETLQTIYLVPKVYELDEITVSSRTNRAKYMEMFKKQFLGPTINGSQCTIDNEDDIAFIYDKTKNILTALSNEPLKIENRSLKYEIDYFLDDFEYSPSNGQLKLLGIYIFRDVNSRNRTDSIKVERKREAAYLGSRMHFFRSLWHDDLASEGYIVADTSFKVVTYKKLVLDIDTIEKYVVNKRILNIDFKRYETSVMEILQDSVYFEKSGYFDPEGISWNGDMAKQRIGDMLPFDYVLRE